MTVGHTTEEPSKLLTMTSKSFNPARLYVAVVFIPLFYALVRFVHPVGLYLLVVITAGLALHEFYALHFSPDQLNREWWIIFLAPLGLLTSLQWPGLLPTSLILTFFALLILSSRLFHTQSTSHKLRDAAVLSLGLAYIVLPLGHVLLLRALDQGIYLIFFLLLVTWSTDTGGFVFGRTLGKRKLAPTISPNKTVEGLFGGLFLAILMAFLAKAWFLPFLSMVDCVAMGLLISSVAVLGDLVESVMKRSAGVKDSGTILPGHGGMLDRIDSLLFTAPCFYYYMVFLKGAATP